MASFLPPLLRNLRIPRAGWWNFPCLTNNRVNCQSCSSSPALAGSFSWGKRISRSRCLARRQINTGFFSFPWSSRNFWYFWMLWWQHEPNCSILLLFWESDTYLESSDRKLETKITISCLSTFEMNRLLGWAFFPCLPQHATWRYLEKTARTFLCWMFWLTDFLSSQSKHTSTFQGQINLHI